MNSRQIKLRFFTIFILSVLIGNCWAQNSSFEKSQLVGKIWQLETPPNATYIYQQIFTDKEITISLVVEDKEEKRTYKYFLTEDPASVYPSSNIPNNSSGRFIISLENGKTERYQIIEATNKKLRIRHLEQHPNNTLTYSVKE